MNANTPNDQNGGCVAIRPQLYNVCYNMVLKRSFCRFCRMCVYGSWRNRKQFVSNPISCSTIASP